MKAPSILSTSAFQKQITSTMVSPFSSSRTARMPQKLVLTRYLLTSVLLVSGNAAAQTYTKTETITYYDNPTHWVMSRPGSVTDVSTGVVQSSVSYDAMGNQTGIYAFGKLKKGMTYNVDGTLASVSDGRVVTTVSNWKRGIPQSIQLAGEPAMTAVVDDNGWITSVTNQVSAKTCYSHDVMGRVTKITYPSETANEVCDTSAWTATTRSFVAVGGVWKETVTTGNAVKVTDYDAMWRPVQTQEYDASNVAATQRFTQTLYDTEGRVVFNSYPSSTAGGGGGTMTVYDPLGRVSAVSQDSELGGLTTSIEYLPGFQTRVTNPRGQPTVYTYLTYDQPTTDWPLTITAPEGQTTTIVRNVFGNAKSITRGGITRNYVYYPTQEVCKVKEPETKSTIYSYDTAGNVAWSASGVNLNSTTTCENTSSLITPRKVVYGYGPRNQLGGLTFPGGLGSMSASFAPDGLVQSMSTSNTGGAVVTSNYSHNKRRLLTTETTVPDGAQAWSTGYVYNTLGNVVTETRPGSVTLAYTVNALGQIGQVVASADTAPAVTLASNASYHPNGALKQFTYGNGIVHAMTQNARQLPARNTDGGILDLATTFDENGNVTALTDFASGRQTRSMSYDGLDRLAGASSPMFGDAYYLYNAADNLTNVSVAGRHQSYIYNSLNQLTNVLDVATGNSVVGMSYDVQGNVSNKSGAVYTFDFGNRLRSWKPTSVSPLETYFYDGLGRRVRQDIAGAQKKYSIYGLDGRLIWQRNEVTAQRINNVYLGGGLIAEYMRPVGVAAPTITYMHMDPLGSPIAKTNTAGTVIETSEYEPFGKLVNRANDDKAGYTGHVMDAASGLTYMQQRYYDPQLGLFLSADPVGAHVERGQNFNRYWYANNNPYRFVDPDGRQSRGDNSEPQQEEKITTLEAVRAIVDVDTPLLSGDLFTIVDLDLTAIYGPEISFGSVFDLDQLLDSGWYFSFNESTGINVGAAVGAGWVAREIEGDGAALDVNLKVVSPTLLFDDQGTNGAAFTVGPGWGASGSTGKTWTLSPNSLLKAAGH